MTGSHFRWLPVIFLMWFVQHLTAQVLPRNEIRIEAGRHWMEPMRNKGHIGAAPIIDGWRPGSYGVSVAYNYLLMRSVKLGINASISDAAFTYTYQSSYEFLGLPASHIGRTKEGLEHHWLPGVAVNFVFSKSLSTKWGSFVSSSYGWQFLPEEQTPYTEYTTLGQPRTTYLTMVRMDNYNSGGGPLPFVRFGIGVDRMFENYNRIGLEVFMLHSFRRDTFRSEYLLYPGTVGESSGTIEGGVSHAGLRLSYTLTSGAPKKPGYLRKAERALY